MNEAPVIDRDAAAALIEPLTDLVIRAGHAILAVNRSAMKVDGKDSGAGPDHQIGQRFDQAGGGVAIDHGGKCLIHMRGS